MWVFKKWRQSTFFLWQHLSAFNSHVKKDSSPLPLFRVSGYCEKINHQCYANVPRVTKNKNMTRWMQQTVTAGFQPSSCLICQTEVRLRLQQKKTFTKTNTKKILTHKCQKFYLWLEFNRMCCWFKFFSDCIFCDLCNWCIFCFYITALCMKSKTPVPHPLPRTNATLCCIAARDCALLKGTLTLKRGVHVLSLFCWRMELPMAWPPACISTPPGNSWNINAGSEAGKWSTNWMH